MKESWDQRYHNQPALYGDAPNAFIQAISQRIEISGESLAIAEGEGRNAIYLAQQARDQSRAFNITLWDYSAVGLQNAQARADDLSLSITTECVDLANAQWPINHYDNIFCVFGHFPTELKHQTLQSIRTALKPNGWFIGEVYSTEQIPYQSGGPRDRAMLYALSDFINTFPDDFFFHLYLGETERFEGHLHSGKCHVIQFAIQIRK